MADADEEPTTQPALLHAEAEVQEDTEAVLGHRVSELFPKCAAEA